MLGASKVRGLPGSAARGNAAGCLEMAVADPVWALCQEVLKLDWTDNGTIDPADFQLQVVWPVPASKSFEGPRARSSGWGTDSTNRRFEGLLQPAGRRTSPPLSHFSNPFMPFEAATAAGGAVTVFRARHGLSWDLIKEQLCHVSTVEVLLQPLTAFLWAAGS